MKAVVVTISNILGLRPTEMNWKSGYLPQDFLASLPKHKSGVIYATSHLGDPATHSVLLQKSVTHRQIVLATSRINGTLALCGYLGVRGKIISKSVKKKTKRDGKERERGKPVLPDKINGSRNPGFRSGGAEIFTRFLRSR